MQLEHEVAAGDSIAADYSSADEKADNFSPPRGAELTRRMEEGDKMATSQINRAVRAVASAILSIYNSYNPPVAVLAGPLAPVYYVGVKDLVEKKLSGKGRANGLEIVFTDMTEMPLRGAATLVLNNPHRAPLTHSHPHLSA